jgi:hypothetical protein
MPGCVPRRSASLILAVAILGSIGCGTVTDIPPVNGESARLAVSANVSSTTIATMVVTVTGPGITPPLVFNLTISGGTATGSITLPAGSNRKLELDAFDDKGIKTHHGETTIAEVKAGANPGITIVLLPLTGQQTVTASLGSVTISITPNPGNVTVGGQTTFTVTLTDSNNNPIVPSASELSCATSKPALFSVGATNVVGGVVTCVASGILVGSGEIVATYNGFAGIATVNVTP